jgi:hypothetical protein
MTSQLDTLSAAFAAIVCPVFGLLTGTAIAESIPIEIPSGWAQFISPASYAACLLYGLNWMARRLEATEKKADARQDVLEKREQVRQVERDNMLKTLVALATETKDVIWQNNHLIEDFNKVARYCPGQEPKTEHTKQ